MTTPPVGQHATILIVDDEDSARSLLSNVLERHGFAVLLASSAEEGLQIFERYRDAITLLLVDLLMPGTNGLDMALMIRAEHPKLPILFMSGSDIVANAFSEYSRFAFLSKPFTPDALLAKIRSLLQISGA